MSRIDRAACLWQLFPCALVSPWRRHMDKRVLPARLLPGSLIPFTRTCTTRYMVRVPPKPRLVVLATYPVSNVSLLSQRSDNTPGNPQHTQHIRRNISAGVSVRATRESTKLYLHNIPGARVPCYQRLPVVSTPVAIFRRLSCTPTVQRNITSQISSNCYTRKHLHYLFIAQYFVLEVGDIRWFDPSEILPLNN